MLKDSLPMRGILKYNFSLSGFYHLTLVLKWYIFYIRIDLTSKEMNNAQEAEPPMWVRQSIDFAHIPHVRLLQCIETFFSDSFTVIIITKKLFNLKIYKFYIL